MLGSWRLWRAFQVISFDFHSKSFAMKKITHLPLIALLLITASTSNKEAKKDDDPNITGTVTGPNGREAGGSVIPEKYDLPTRYAKIVVTDSIGRYLIPELPSANYKVCGSGYGLIDSEKKDAKLGAILDLTAVVAPSEAGPRSIILQVIGSRSSMYPINRCFPE